jgi:hypothetical protein
VALPERVALLLNFSMLHLALATATGDGVRRQAMLANLYTITKAFQNVDVFPSVMRDLQKLEPGIESVGEGLSISTHTGPSRGLFQQLLKALEDHCPRLRPFRYHVENGVVHLTD